MGRNSFLVLIFSILCIQTVRMHSKDYFALKLLNNIALPKSSENVIFSPISIETCVAALVAGAGGNTQYQIREAIDLKTESMSVIGETFKDLIEDKFKWRNEGVPQLKMINGIFLPVSHTIKPDFIQFVKQYFFAKTESIMDFSNPHVVAEHINEWIETESGNKIKNFVKPNMIKQETSMLLINAIYFKGYWQQEFLMEATDKEQYSVTLTKNVTVDMMYNTGAFKYAEFPEFNAKAIQLPYKNSNIYMLIVLPNEIEGLYALEQKIARSNFRELSNKMNVYNTEIYLPKFGVTSDIDIKQGLQNIGLRDMFGTSADFSSLSRYRKKVSNFYHFATLSVNEMGSEASAGTIANPVPMDAPSNLKEFRVDHPFTFAIMDNEVVYFAGHVVEPK